MTVRPYTELTIPKEKAFALLHNLFRVERVLGTVEIFDKNDRVGSEQRRVGILYNSSKGGSDMLRCRAKNLTLTEIAGRLRLSGENYPIKYWQGDKIIKPTSFLNVGEDGLGRFIEIYPKGRDHEYAILPIINGISGIKDDVIGSYKISSANAKQNRHNKPQEYTVLHDVYTVNFYLLPNTKISQKDIGVILKSASPLFKAIGKDID